MSYNTISFISIVILLFVIKCSTWKAVPANQAIYARRAIVADKNEDEEEQIADKDKNDDDLPRRTLHSAYKFGWCSPDSTVPQYLRKSINMTMAKYNDFKIRYIYLLDTKHTQRFNLQCVIMKAYTPLKYQFRKSRIPMYYCQGQSDGVLRDFGACHDNFDMRPSDGILKPHSFTWLAFVQYIHVTTGLLHHSKAPRVIMVQKQFVLGTATDLLRLPKNYKLGNVVFGDYEREEEECDLTKSQINMGVTCAPAYLEVPISDITPHPEYSRFGVGNSLTLVKLIRPLKSNYMIPVCLPSVGEREKKRKNKFVFMIDYISSVPRDFDSEKMGKKSLKLYTHKDCRRHRMRSRLGSEGVTHVLCSSGCGVRPGAPIINHAMSGAFELVGLAAGGAPCSRKSMRRRMNAEPPLYIDVYPYMSWIINVITAHILPLPYPQNFKLTETGSSIGVNRVGYLRKRKRQKAGWKARTYVSGNFCYRTARKQRQAALFYTETFEVNADPPAKLNLFMKISAGMECTIMCARLLMPNRLTTPLILGVGGYNISIEFSSEWFPWVYYFSLGLTGKNSTLSDMQDWAHERSPGFW